MYVECIWAKKIVEINEKIISTTYGLHWFCYTIWYSSHVRISCPNSTHFVYKILRQNNKLCFATALFILTSFFKFGYIFCLRASLLIFGPYSKYFAMKAQFKYYYFDFSL